jgi:hypothetical protein
VYFNQIICYPTIFYSIFLILSCSIIVFKQTSSAAEFFLLFFFVLYALSEFKNKFSGGEHVRCGPGFAWSRPVRCRERFPARTGREVRSIKTVLSNGCHRHLSPAAITCDLLFIADHGTRHNRRKATAPPERLSPDTRPRPWRPGESPP